MTPAERAAHKAIFEAYLAILLSLDTTTRAGCLAWARAAIQARREAVKAGIGDVTLRYLADAAHARDKAHELAAPKPLDLGRVRLVLAKAGAPSAAIERCLDVARADTGGEAMACRGERGAA